MRFSGTQMSNKTEKLKNSRRKMLRQDAQQNQNVGAGADENIRRGHKVATKWIIKILQSRSKCCFVKFSCGGTH
jgi:hypothetical protein